MYGLLYRRIIGARIRSDWQYRTSFFTFLAGQAMVTSLEFVTVLLVLEVSPSLGGWDVHEVAFLYGMATVPFAIADVFISPVERVTDYVQAGTFDRILLRPLPALLQVTSQEFELRRVGKLIPAVAVLLWAIPSVDVTWSPTEIGLLLVAVTCGTVVYSSLWVVGAAASFWLIASRPAMNALTYGGQYANQYPLHLYQGWIRAVLGWAIPLAFVAYVPTVFLLGAPNPLNLPRYLMYLIVPVAAASVAVAGFIWRLGIGHYQGTGS